MKKTKYIEGFGTVIDNSGQDNTVKLSPSQQATRMAIRLNKAKEEERLAVQKKFRDQQQEIANAKLDKLFNKGMPDSKDRAMTDREEYHLDMMSKEDDFTSYDLNYLRVFAPKRYDILVKKGAFERVVYGKDKSITDEVGTTQKIVHNEERADELQEMFDAKSAELEALKEAEAEKAQIRYTQRGIFDKGTESI